jgi:hypothetical protein
LDLPVRYLYQKDCADLIRVHPDDLKQVQDGFQLCKTKTVFSEFRFLPTDEEIAAGFTERWVEASGGPVFDDNGVVVMLSGGFILPLPVNQI